MILKNIHQQPAPAANTYARTAHTTYPEIQPSAEKWNVTGAQYVNSNRGLNMTITWTDKQRSRLKTLNAGTGNRAGLCKGGPNKCKIKIRELQYIKHAQDSGMNRPYIMKVTGLSHYIVTQAMDGAYDHLLRYAQE